MRLLIALCALAFASTAQAGAPGGKGPFGLGVALGDPSALTAKYWTGDRLALQFNLSWSFRHDWLGLTADYLYHHYNVVPAFGSGEIKVPLYVGIGGAFFSHIDTDHDGGRTNLGVRIPLGVALEWRDFPLDVFVEIEPYVFLLPDIHADLGGVLGARWYF